MASILTAFNTGGFAALLASVLQVRVVLQV